MEMLRTNTIPEGWKTHSGGLRNGMASNFFSTERSSACILRMNQNTDGKSGIIVENTIQELTVAISTRIGGELLTAPAGLTGA